MAELKVGDFMTAKVLTAHPDDGVRRTFFRMRDHNVRHFPVVEDGSRLVGIISDRDLRRPQWVDEAPDITHLYNLDDDLTVGDLMSTNVFVARTYESLHKATRILFEHRFGALPVLNKEDRLVGMLSAIDLLQALERLLDD